MLSRASSDAAGRLRRAKSTSSTHGRQRGQPSEPADPELTRQHALRAATRAYEKANGMPLGALDNRETRTHAQADRGERRSTRQNSLQSRPSLPNLPTGQVPRLDRRRRLEGQTGYGGGWKANDSILQQQSTTTEPRSNVGRNSGNNTGTTDLPTSREVRTVRHTRSSYSEHSAAAPNYDQFKKDIPGARYKPAIDTSSKEATKAHDYQNKRILTPLAGESSHPCNKRPKSTEHAIAAARDKYFQTFQTGATQSGSCLPPTPAIPSQAEFSHAMHRRAESSPAWEGSEMKSNGTETSKFGQKGKGFSTSIRKSVKKFFRRAPAQDELPLQQVEAGRLHFQVDSEIVHQTFEDSHRNSEDMFAKAGSRTRGLRNVHSQSSIRSRSSSNGSLRRRTHSPHDSSRVTSWNTSTAANTITTQGTKRLSVIKEDCGSHRSAKVPGTHPQLHECGIGRKPRRVGSRLSIYSALMRRIDESNLDSSEHSVTVVEKDGFITSGADKKSSHSRLDSLASTASRFTKSTIRAVASRETFRNFSGSSRTSSTVVHTEAAANTSSDARGVGTGTAARISALDHNATGSNLHCDYVSPTREQLAGRMQRTENRWKAPLDDVRSGFFPSHSRRIMYTDNPYELAPRQLPTEQRSSPVKSNESIVQKDRGTPPAICSDGAIRTQGRLMSPSVYSCDTSGQSPLRNSSTVSLAESQLGITGTAVVTPTQPVAKYAIGAQAAPPAKAQHMPMQSKDWRAWTAKKVAELEAEVKATGILIEEDYKPQPRRTGHRRERAQISNDSGETSIAAAPLSAPPLRRKRTRPRLSEEASSKAREKMNERFPYLETRRNASSEKKKPQQKITAPRIENEGSAKDAERIAAYSSVESVLQAQVNGQPRQTSNIPKPFLKRPQSTGQLPSTVKNGYELTPPTAFPSPSPTARMTTARTPPQVPKRPTPKSKENTPPSRIQLQPSEPTTAYRPARGSVSTANLHGRYQAGNLTRKPFATAAAMQEDADGMMRRISAGPWVDDSSPGVASGADVGVTESAKWSWKNEGTKENVSPAGGGAGSMGYASARSRRAVNVFEQVRRERGGGREKERWGSGGKDGSMMGSGVSRFGSVSPAFI